MSESNRESQFGTQYYNGKRQWGWIHHVFLRNHTFFCPFSAELFCFLFIKKCQKSVIFMCHQFNGQVSNFVANIIFIIIGLYRVFQKFYLISWEQVLLKKSLVSVCGDNSFFIKFCNRHLLKRWHQTFIQQCPIKLISSSEKTPAVYHPVLEEFSTHIS